MVPRRSYVEFFVYIIKNITFSERFLCRTFWHNHYDQLLLFKISSSSLVPQHRWPCVLPLPTLHLHERLSCGIFGFILLYGFSLITHKSYRNKQFGVECRNTAGRVLGGRRWGFSGS